MSQEGMNLSQEVEGSNDQDTATSAINNPGLFECASSKIASPTVLLADEDRNAASSKIAYMAVLHTDEDNNAAPKIARGRGKGSAAMVEDADHNLHIFMERGRTKKMKNMFSTLHRLLPHLPDKADEATILEGAVSYIKTLERRIQKLEIEHQLQVGAGSRRGTSVPPARLPAPSPPPPAASWSREAYLADMVHSLQAQQAAVDAKNRARSAAAVGCSSCLSAVAQQLPPGAVPFPAPAPAPGFQTWSGENAVLSVASNEAYINLRCPRDPDALAKALFVLERNHIEVINTTIYTQGGVRMYDIHARATPASAPARFPENLSAEDRFKLAVSEMLQMINI